MSNSSAEAAADKKKPLESMMRKILTSNSKHLRQCLSSSVNSVAATSGPEAYSQNQTYLEIGTARPDCVLFRHLDCVSFALPCECQTLVKSQKQISQNNSQGDFQKDYTNRFRRIIHNKISQSNLQND